MNPLCRVLLIGDIHGQLSALQTALHHAHTLAVDAMLCTGDLPAKGYALSSDTAITINTVARTLADGNVFTVRGNHDRYFAENAADPTLAELFRAEWDASHDALTYVQSLPATRRFQTAMGALLLCHGFGADDMVGIYPGGDDAPIADILATIPGERPRFVVAGHTHRHMVRTVAGVTIINPGSLLGDAEPPGFAIADFDAGAITFYQIASGGEATRDAVLLYNEIV